MKTPACDPGDFYIALRAESTLFIPEIAKSAGTPKRLQHVSPFAFLEVGFIGWIVRVSFAFDLDVPFDGSALGVVQPDFSWPSFVIAGFTEEGPVTIPASVKVFRFEPARPFVRVPSSCPLPQTGEDVAIHVSKRAFAHHVPMIVRPTANLWVKLIDQIGGRHAMCSFDDSSDALEEGSNILLGRLDEQFSVRVSAHVLSEEIKAALHVRNDSLRRSVGEPFDRPKVRHPIDHYTEREAQIAHLNTILFMGHRKKRFRQSPQRSGFRKINVRSPCSTKPLRLEGPSSSFTMAGWTDVH
jgi:hypothetical protein